jgi:alkylation response protein AidB-like acyl-CoA dehydrogenase
MMNGELTEAQRTSHAEFRAFADEYLAPAANDFDRQERIPRDLIADLGKQGYLGAIAPVDYGGGGVDAITWGLLCEAIGRVSGSLLSLLTVHSMVIQALVKWGSNEQQVEWLPKLATGEAIGAFGLSEPGIGSDAAHCETTAQLEGDDFVINGRKRWISFGQVADVFLVFGAMQSQSTVFLVESDRDGFSRDPIGGLSGFRAAMMAELTFEKCRVPERNVVGRPGFGFSHVGGTALDQGRFSIAWGSVGLMQGCLDASLSYAAEREQFGVPLREHQLIKGMIANMHVQTKAARLLCENAARLRESSDPSVIMETSIAKYFGSRAAVKVALDAVQIHGANGCTDEYPVARYLRDAKILEIIEGSNEMQQILISRYGYQAHRAGGR